MPKSPFKFLDSFTKEDKAIFFGRDRETEELYQKVFESKILLVYGVSGTGKSSLIHCGLANKFNDSDWLPINVRRGGDINDSLVKALAKYSFSEVSQQSAVSSQQDDMPTEDWRLKTSDLDQTKSTKLTKQTKPLTKLLKNLYLDHFKPIYLIFDQFEELFIFGSKSEKEEFIQSIKKIVDSEIQCKFLFVIREEYLAGITEFEKEIPTFLQNRIRIEKMTRTNAVQCIEGPCKVHDITVEEGFSEALLEKLSPGSTDVELTYMQVYLDKIFRESGGENFNQSILDKLGDVKDLLGSFLEEQIATLDDPDSALAILKSFVSVKGTKRQITEEEINEHCKTIGKDVAQATLQKQIAHFVNIRILRDKDESGRYELRHDALAAKIYEKITLVEKELMEIRQFIENAYDNYQKRNILLSVSDLKYIGPYEDKLILNEKIQSFISKSKQEIGKVKRRKRILAFSALIILLAVFAGFTIWALGERSKAIEQKSIAEEQTRLAIEANKTAEKAVEDKEKAEKELEKVKSTAIVIATDKMNVLYRGIDNPISVAASGFKLEDISVTGKNCIVRAVQLGKYVVRPGKGDTARFSVSAKIDGEIKILGTKTLRVLDVPDPIALIASKKGGVIKKEVLLAQDGIEAVLENFPFDLRFQIVSFIVVCKTSGGFWVEQKGKGSDFDSKQKKIINSLKVGQRMFIVDIKAKGPDGKMRDCGGLNLKILP